MTLREKIMKLQTYKMYEGEATVYVERDDILKLLEQQPCEDAISRKAAIDAMFSLCGDGTLKENEWRDNPHIDSIIDAINDLPSVRVNADKAIKLMEEARDKDKLCEYPYNRCINILMDTAPKRKAAIERQVIVTWFTPEEKLPEEDVAVLATVTAVAGNKKFIRTILPVFYCASEGWYELDYGFSEMTVHAWCDLDPYEGG